MGKKYGDWRDSQPNDAWAKVTDFHDPVSGKRLPQNPQGNATSLAKQMGTSVPKGPNSDDQ